MQTEQARKAAAPVFAIVMFASASLIFLLQPMFARMTTPELGGSPGVWNTSMVFFQAALLLGYVYAHRLARLASLRTQVMIHAGVLAVAVLALVLASGGLKVSVSHLLGAPDAQRPIGWLLGVLTVSVGAPYAAISATAPLLQAWYARTGREDAADPYHLYAASNLGSMLGLAAYPIAVEPLLGVSMQAVFWAVGFVIVGAAIVGAGVVALQTGGETSRHDEEASAPSTWGDRLFWVAAAAAPSSLMLGVTMHISTDIASAPFLWVVPLALYLLTFVVAFGKNAEAWRDPVALLHPISLAALLIAFTQNDFWFTLASNLACFFLSALVCHLALSARRPPVGRLTEFYMWVSIGGVVGGAATALLAPVLFDDVYEYPLALAAVALFLPRRDRPLSRTVTASLGAAALIAAALVLLRDGDAWRNPFAKDALDLQDWVRALTFVSLGLLAVAAAAEQVFAKQASRVLAALLAAAAIARLLMEKDGVQPLDISISVGMFGFALLLLVAERRQLAREIAAILGIGLAGTLVVNHFVSHNRAPDALLFVVLGVIAVAILANRARPILAASLVAAAFVGIYANSAERSIAYKGRSFFGVTRVVNYPSTSTVIGSTVIDGKRYPTYGAMKDGDLRVMMHGTTIHGAQYVTGSRTREPLTYYHPDTGIGRAVQAALARHPQGRLGLIGLGSGSTACLKRPQDTLTIFEIDPKVVKFSTQTGVFTFVKQCAPDFKLVLGDGRIGMEGQADNSLDVLVVDAFSSDAVPAHLLTKEAIALYLRKLAPDGIIVLHLSNRNLDLVGEASRVARQGGHGALWASIDGTESEDYYTSFSTSVLIIGRTQAVVDGLNLGPAWQPAEDLPGRAWSDEYVNMVRPLLSQLSQ